MKKLAQWHKTKLGLLTFAVIELVLTVLFAEWAIGNGNLLLYLLGIIFLVGFMQNLVKLVWKIVHGNKTREA
jgi:hypothetical protein